MAAGPSAASCGSDWRSAGARPVDRPHVGGDGRCPGRRRRRQRDRADTAGGAPARLGGDDRQASRAVHAALLGDVPVRPARAAADRQRASSTRGRTPSPLPGVTLASELGSRWRRRTRARPFGRGVPRRGAVAKVELVLVTPATPEGAAVAVKRTLAPTGTQPSPGRTRRGWSRPRPPASRSRGTWAGISPPTNSIRSVPSTSALYMAMYGSRTGVGPAGSSGSVDRAGREPPDLDRPDALAVGHARRWPRTSPACRTPASAPPRSRRSGRGTCTRDRWCPRAARWG